MLAAHGGAKGSARGFRLLRVRAITGQPARAAPSAQTHSRQVAARLRRGGIAEHTGAIHSGYWALNSTAMASVASNASVWSDSSAIDSAASMANTFANRSISAISFGA